MKAKPTTVYFNGSCPVCSREIAHYRKAADAAQAPLAWCDLSQQPEALRARGIHGEAAFARLHAVDGDGRLLEGVDAFLALWSQLPGWRIAARVLGRPWPKRCMDVVYERVLAPWLLARHRRRAARLASRRARG
ncbi:MAG: DUF393 domain-containing protein [Geminicoccaceae bacterium]